MFQDLVGASQAGDRGGGVAEHRRSGRDVEQHHAADAHDGVVADLAIGHDARAGIHGRAVADFHVAAN